MEHRVLIVTTVSGFLCQFEKNTVEVLRGQGAEIHYASNFAYSAYEFDSLYLHENDIKVHPISIRKSPRNAGANFKAMFELVRIIRKEKIDTVHCHNPVGGVLGRLAALLSGRKVNVVYTAHGFHFYRGGPLLSWLLFYPVESILARITDVIITINSEDRMTAGKFRLKKGGRVEIIPGVGVDMDKFRPCPEKRKAARETMGVRDGQICLLTSALLTREKNYHMVLHALAGMRNRNFYYVICGEGPYRAVLERKITELGLERQVKIMGFRRDMDFLLQGADVFLFPSLREGLGMAALEAMACAVPVAAADNRGTREYILHGINGFMCDGRKGKRFREILELLCESEEIRISVSENSRKKCMEFSKEKSTEKMAQIYRYLWREKDEDESQCDYECVQSESVFTA